MLEVGYKSAKTGARILEAYTLCDADCEPGYHNPDYRICERCGARIHVAVYEVETASGEELTVGRECLKDVLGFRPSPWHKKAEKVAAKLAQVSCLRAGFTIKAYPSSPKIAYLVNRYGYIVREVRVPHNLSETLLRAGADIGLWTYPIVKRRKYTHGLYYEVEYLGGE